MPRLNFGSTPEKGAITMSYTTSWTKPILRLNKTEEAERARALLDAYDIDLEICETNAPVSLEWNGIVYQGLFGVADFLMFVARLPIPGIRKSDRAVDGRPAGARIEIPPLWETPRA
jgi:hypothetical protein